MQQFWRNKVTCEEKIQTIYLTGNFGIRIEDTVLVTKQGAITLTESNKQCIII